MPRSSSHPAMLETSKWWPISCAGISISGPSSCCLGIQPADNHYLYPCSPDGPPNHEPAGSVVGGPTMPAVAAAGTGPRRTFHVRQSFVSWCGPMTAIRQFKRTQDRLLWVDFTCSGSVNTVAKAGVASGGLDEVATIAASGLVAVGVTRSNRHSSPPPIASSKAKITISVPLTFCAPRSPWYQVITSTTKNPTASVRISSFSIWSGHPKRCATMSTPCNNANANPT